MKKDITTKEIVKSIREAKLKEAEKMLREIEFEKLPSFELGLEKGIQKGIENGIQKAKVDIVKNLLILHDDETISKITGLDIDKIKEIRNKK